MTQRFSSIFKENVTLMWKTCSKRNIKQEMLPILLIKVRQIIHSCIRNLRFINVKHWCSERLAFKKDWFWLLLLKVSLILFSGRKISRLLFLLHSKGMMIKLLPCFSYLISIIQFLSVKYEYKHQRLFLNKYD